MDSRFVSIHNLLTEVDNSIVIFVILSVIVSIHNLLTEVDSANSRIYTGLMSFQFTTSLRRLTSFTKFVWIILLFQFTTSLRRLTSECGINPGRCCVSIHNLLTEVDHCLESQWSIWWVSIHNLLTEVDQNYSVIWCPFCVSIHNLLTEVDSNIAYIFSVN